MWLVILLSVLILYLVATRFSSSNNSPYTNPSTPQPAEASLADMYNQSLTDASLVRLTNAGYSDPQSVLMPRDCLKLRNPSTILTACSGKSPSSLRTSSQWYLSRPDPNMVIMDPDGWRDLTNPTQYWYSQLISYDEYAKREARSSMAPAPYPEMKYVEPF